MMPISWNADSIDTVVIELWTNEDSYTFLSANFGGCVAGMNTWKFEVLSGAKKPLEVLSKSSEALLLLILPIYWKAWEAQTHDHNSSLRNLLSHWDWYQAFPQQASCCTQETITAAQRMDGALSDGIQCFEELRTKVEEDQNSKHGKEFEMKFQRLMKDCQTELASRKSECSSAGDQLTSIQNELSDASSSQQQGK
jgi:hypothetical protein